MGKAIIYMALGALIGLAVPAVAPAQENAQAEVPALVDNPPSRYVVVKGDTLWGISARFLRDPWRWPDIWGLNRDQIRNPHWIYPGDVIVLDYAGGVPRLRFEGDDDGAWQLLIARLNPKIRTQGLPPGAIPSIPSANLQAFLTRPLVIEEHELALAPTIIASRDGRVVMGHNDIAFVEGVVVADGQRFQVVRPGRVFKDPDSGEILAREAIYLGDAVVTEYGEISTINIAKAVQEIAPGDKLVSAPAETSSPYMPHAPATQVQGKIIAGPNDSVTEIAPQTAVVLNRGARDGLERGHVLAISRAGNVVRPPGSADANARVRLPDERYGVVFVFRVFDRVSYALVMNTTRPVRVLDVVKTP